MAAHDEVGEHPISAASQLRLGVSQRIPAGPALTNNLPLLQSPGIEKHKQASAHSSSLNKIRVQVNKDVDYRSELRVSYINASLIIQIAPKGCVLVKCGSMKKDAVHFFPALYISTSLLRSPPTETFSDTYSHGCYEELSIFVLCVYTPIFKHNASMESSCLAVLPRTIFHSLKYICGRELDDRRPTNS